MQKIIILSFLLSAPALAEDIDRAPSGVIVTIRPDTEEQAAIISSSSTPLQLPDDAPQPMWLINPEAWRRATAEVERLSVYPEIAHDHELAIVRLTTELEGSQQLLSVEQQARIQAETEAVMYKQQRPKWALAGAGAGAAVVAVGIVVAAVAL